MRPDGRASWRIGLDRWLERRARIKLARLVWRPGWLRVTDERLIVRFPPAAADIRLRRRALDVDPGWTDWLGLAVRYLYAERNRCERALPGWNSQLQGARRRPAPRGMRQGSAAVGTRPAWKRWWRP